jgi:hypothetical protein
MTHGPSTTAGRWALALLLAFSVALAALIVSSASGQKGGDAFTDNWWLAGPALAAFLTALTALVAGGYAIVAQHDRSPLVILAAAVGAVVVLFVAAELTLRH